MLCCGGWGQSAWWARPTCHLSILRLTTRGAARILQGERAAVRHGLSADPERCDEAGAVGFVPGVDGGVGLQGADGEVAARVSPDFLDDQFGGLGPQHGTWPTLVGHDGSSLWMGAYPFSTTMSTARGSSTRARRSTRFGWCGPRSSRRVSFTSSTRRVNFAAVRRRRRHRQDSGSEPRLIGLDADGAGSADLVHPDGGAPGRVG